MLNSHLFYNPPTVSGTNFDAFLESFAGHVRPFSARLKGGKGQEFRWWSNVVAAPDVTLFHMRYSADWSLSPETDDESLNIILLFSGGRYDAVIGSDEVAAVPGTAVLIPTARLHRIATINGPQISRANLVFSSAAVKRILFSMFGDISLSSLELTPLFDLTTPTGRTFSWLIHSIACGMVGDRVLESSPKAMALLVEVALRFIFENVPHRLSNRMHRRLLDVAPRHVRAATDFMHANMHRPITVTDIAEAVGVSVRSLQTGFQQYCDTTPAAYLRRIRLEAAHVELSTPGNRLLVKEVALKWGFFHLGRFAQQYRSAYGVLPSETVKRAHLL